MRTKAIQIILEALKVIFISFVIALIILFVDEKNFLHVILSIPIVLVLVYILIEKSFISNKQNKEKVCQKCRKSKKNLRSKKGGCLFRHKLG